MDGIVICTKKGADMDLARSLAKKMDVPLVSEEGKELTICIDSKGVLLSGYGLTYQGDFDSMTRRVTEGRLLHEMLVKAVKTDTPNPKAIDATAGMGEDSFLIAAAGYQVTLQEQNPVIAALLKDAVRRGKKNSAIKDIVNRMSVVEGESAQILRSMIDEVDLIYLDPMFPARQKSGLINKKLQLIQKLEPPCTDEHELFEAAISARPKKIVVKRPLKSPYLDGKEPNYQLKGKAIRYDCYIYDRT